MGFFALLLKYLSISQALLCALLAIIHNLYIFPLYGRKKIEKEFEKEKRYSAIVSYPVVVFLIILFSDFVISSNLRMAMAIASASWAILAFGDSSAGFFGKVIGGPKLKWNNEKTFAGFISFIIFSFFSSYLFFNYIAFDSFSNFNLNLLILSAISAIVCAVTESIKGQFDDNISFPFVAFSIFSFYPFFDIYKKNIFLFQLKENFNFKIFLILIFLNFLFAFTSYLKKWVDKNGFIFGLILGFSVIFSLGFKGYLILILFFIVANFSTFYGKKIKEIKRIEEANKGKRGLESVFSKGIAPFVFSFLSFEAFALTLCFYAADTVATEFGKTSKGNTFSLLEIVKVPAGKRGGVSFKGTFFGILTIVIFTFLSVFNYKLLVFPAKFYVLTTLLIILFFFIESIVNEIDDRLGVTNKVIIHIVLGFLLGAFCNSLFYNCVI